MIKITLEYPNLDEAIVALGTLAESAVAAKAGKGKPATVAGEVAKAATAEVAQKEKPKKSRGKKKAEPAPEVAKAADAGHTREDCLAALKPVNEKKGIQGCIDLLSKFTDANGNPVKRVSDMKVEDYVSFIAFCENAVA